MFPFRSTKEKEEKSYALVKTRCIPFHKAINISFMSKVQDINLPLTWVDLHTLCTYARITYNVWASYLLSLPIIVLRWWGTIGQRGNIDDRYSTRQQNWVLSLMKLRTEKVVKIEIKLCGTTCEWFNDTFCNLFDYFSFFFLILSALGSLIFVRLSLRMTFRCKIDKRVA